MGKLDAEIDLKSSPEKLWGVIRDSTNLLPKIFPDRYKSVEILEGDGKSAGSIIVMKYVEGKPTYTIW